MSGSSSNGTLSTCDFTTINDFLSTVTTARQNVTFIVQQCPQLCTVAWGFGNPDISGVGAFTSYITQTALTVILGPMFLIGTTLATVCIGPNEIASKFQEIQSEFHGTSALFSLATAVAAIVRAHQGATLFESSFIQTLLTMQFLGAISDVITMSNFIFGSSSRESQKPYKVQSSRLNGMPIILRVFFFVAQLCLYSTYMGQFNITKAAYSSITQFFVACPHYGGLDPAVTLQRPDVGVGIVNALLTIAFTQEDNEGAGILLIVVVFGAVICTIGGSIWCTLRFPLCGGPVCLGLCGGMIFYTVKMDQERTFIKSLAGSQYQDDQWYFGQVVAVFVWIPLLTTICEVFAKREFQENVESVAEEGEETDVASISRPRFSWEIQLDTEGIPRQSLAGLEGREMVPLQRSDSSTSSVREIETSRKLRRPPAASLGSMSFGTYSRLPI